jgi:hypothetical protein
LGVSLKKGNFFLDGNGEKVFEIGNGLRNFREA